MQILELTVIVKGPTWPIKEFEIEGVSVMELREPGDGEVSVTIKNTPLSADDTIDVFVHQTAPNGINYTVEISGKLKDGAAIHDIAYESEKFKTKFGHARITISKNVNTIIK